MLYSLVKSTLTRKLCYRKDAVLYEVLCTSTKVKVKVSHIFTQVKVKVVQKKFY